MSLAVKSLERSMWSTKEAAGGYVIGCMEVKKFNYRKAITKNFRARKPSKLYLDKIRNHKKDIARYEEKHNID